MLNKFDASLITFNRVKIKSVSTALGGSLTILDEDASAHKGKEVFKRIDIPMALARMFQVKYKVSRFMKPHEGALMMYDNKVIAIEKSVFDTRTTEGLFGDREWLVTMEKNLATIMENQINPLEKQWYFDGTFVYGFKTDDITQAIQAGERLDNTGKFRAIPVEAVHMNYLAFTAPLTEHRLCIAYTASNGEFAITPPIWKSLGSKMGGSTAKKNADEDTGLSSNFSEVDNVMAVSLNFALSAGKELADAFGYDVIQPLQLPKLMVQLKTVNLPKLPKEIKATFDIGMTFTQTFAWLLGLVKNAQTLEQEESVRRLMKYLTSKGIFRKDSLKKEKIYMGGQISAIPMLTIAEAKEQAASSDMLKLLEERWLKKLRAKYRDEEGHMVDHSMALDMM
jgi:hypothetical protein